MSVFFSIIVPIYNVELYLNQCLDSIVEQDFQDYEVIMVNDGTKDRSAEIAAEYVSRDSRFKLFNKENGGLSSARNFGLEHANGMYVYFLDSDDYIRNDALSVLHRVIQKNPVDVVFFSAHIFRHPNPEDTIKYLRRIPVEEPITGMEYIEKMYPLDNLYTLSPLFVSKRNVLISNCLEFCKNYIYEDEEFVMKLCLNSNSVLAIDEVLFFYRVRDSSITQSSLRLINIQSYLYVANSLVNESLKSNVSTKAASVLHKRSRALYFQAKKCCPALVADNLLAKQACKEYRNNFIFNSKVSIKNKVGFVLYQFARGVLG